MLFTPIFKMADSSNQKQLIAFLKKKGTGPTMSKSLTPEDFPILESCFLATDCHLTTKATLLTAILLLDATDEEQNWINSLLSDPHSKLPTELIALIPGTQTELPIIKLIHKLIHKTDLSAEEFKQGFSDVLNANTPEYLKAAFLEGLRLKRETIEENRLAYDMLWETTSRTKVNLPILIDLSYAYDGFNRSLFLAPFTASLLASIGFPTLLHGVFEVSPKKGINTHKLLTEADKNPFLPLEKTCQNLQEIGWGYIDLKQFNPTLSSLTELRQNMVKRPILATFDKLLKPIEADTNILITGYTHPPYKDKLVTLFQETQRYNKTLIIRGVEGSPQFPMDRKCPTILLENKTSNENFMRPHHFGFHEEKYINIENPAPSEVLNYGLDAIRGTSPHLTNELIFQAAGILTRIGLLTQSEAVKKCRRSIESGAAEKAWELGAR